MHTAYTQDLAAYNRWMNTRLYAVCAELTDAQRREDRGVFFKSVHGTLNHLVLTDKLWLGRFLGEPFSIRSLDQELYADFGALRRAREKTDTKIIAWAETLSDDTLRGTLRYTSAISAQPRRYEMATAVTHFFNHQTHHRGQLTALLSQFGKDYGVTDLIRLPDVVDRHDI